MAATHETTWFDVNDCKVYSLLTDSSSASPTYGAAVDVPGINQVSIDPNFISAVLKGDARTIARKGRIDGFSFKAKYSKLALDVLTAIMGGTTTDSGTGNTEEAAWALTAPGTLPYFKVEFKCDDADSTLATVHCILYKCKVTGGTLIDGQTENFSQPTFDADAIAPDYASTPYIKIRLLETATNLSS